MAENDTQATETTQTETTQATETKAETTAQATEAAKSTETKATETKPAELKADETKTTEPDYKAEAAGYATRAIQAEARAALSALGVPAARLDAALKVAELSGIDLKDAKAGEKIAAAAQKVLELVPEFKGGAGTGSTVATPRKPGALDDFQKGYLGAK